MMTTLIEKIVGELGDKRRWRQYVPMDVGMSMLEDLAGRFELAAADGTPISAVVGVDPVEFAETHFGKYSDGRWISREREQSLSAIERGFYAEIERGIGKERGRLVSAIKRADAGGGSRS
jgi:DNA-binding ferritin-like protein (Dps family)